MRAFANCPEASRPDGLRFRAVEADDLAFVYDLYAHVRAPELAAVPWTEADKARFLEQQAQLQHRHYTDNYPGADLLLIEDASGPIGRIYVFRSRAEIRLMDIALLPQWRGKGVGSRLLAELLDEARATDCCVTLHVEPHNPAQRLYARLGFRLVEQRGVYDFLRWEKPLPVS